MLTFCQWEIVCSFLGLLHANLYCYNIPFFPSFIHADQCYYIIFLRVRNVACSLYRAMAGRCQLIIGSYTGQYHPSIMQMLANSLFSSNHNDVANSL